MSNYFMNLMDTDSGKVGTIELPDNCAIIVRFATEEIEHIDAKGHRAIYHAHTVQKLTKLINELINF